MTTASNMEVLQRASAAVAELQQVQLETMAPADQLRFVRGVEVLRRRIEHGADRATALIDASAAYSFDGHRNAKGAAKHLGRLSGAEALGRIQTIRAWRFLPEVEAAYAGGKIPIAHMRLIARVAANPRVHEHLEEADPLFVERASQQSDDCFADWIRQWELAADPDGAERDDTVAHENRRVSLTRNFDGSYTVEGQFGALQGATLEEILSHLEQAEFAADWAEARERLGGSACAADLARTAAQRRADAMVAMASASVATPADARRPDPLVDIVVDQETFEDELRRSCGQDVARDPNEAADGRVCHTSDQWIGLRQGRGVPGMLDGRMGFRASGVDLPSAEESLERWAERVDLAGAPTGEVVVLVNELHQRIAELEALHRRALEELTGDRRQLIDEAVDEIRKLLFAT